MFNSIFSKANLSPLASHSITIKILISVKSVSGCNVVPIKSDPLGIVNNDLEKVHSDITSIIRAERLKRVDRQALVDFVNLLNSEFEGKY